VNGAAAMIAILTDRERDCPPGCDGWSASLTLALAIIPPDSRPFDLYETRAIDFEHVGTFSGARKVA
jgi:hypothetical protein